MNKKIAFCFWLFAIGFMPAGAQRVLSLDSCRQMALRNNKQLGVSKLKQDVAANLRKSARTKYLPHVSATSTPVSRYRFLVRLRKQSSARLEQRSVPGWPKV